MKIFLVIFAFLAITKNLFAMDAKLPAADPEPRTIRITFKLRTSSPDGKNHLPLMIY